MVRALNGVTLAVERGETLAVVGESGSGKSTLARTLVRLIEADSGQILFDGEDVRAFRGEALRRYNRRVQMVFQDPYGSLNPRMTVGEMLGEALRVHELVSPARSACPHRRAAGPRATTGRCVTAPSARILRRAAPAHRHRPCPFGGTTSC